MGAHIQHANIIPRLDMGLLAVLVAIDDAGSVSIAAERLNLSQPSVSHALKRLRLLTGDRLFNRERGRLMRTPRAMQLLPQARQLVADATRMLSPSPFDPRNNHYTYRMAVSDYSLVACFQPVARAMRAASPLSRCTAAWAGDGVFENLLARKTDFAFTGDIASPFVGRELAVVELFQENYVGVMCRNHPLARAAARTKVSLKQWIAFEHVQFVNSSPSASMIDKALLATGGERRVSLRSPSHTFNLSSLPGTHSLYALPSRLKELVDERVLALFDLPLKIRPFPFHVVYAKAAQEEPALSFMRELILKVFAVPWPERPGGSFPVPRGSEKQ